MSILEAYKILQNKCGIEVGDKVKVLRRASNYQMGWNLQWASVMDDYIGKSLVVKGVGSTGILLDQFWFPWFVLELVEKKKKEVRELTVSQISEKLGYPIKIVKE